MEEHSNPLAIESHPAVVDVDRIAADPDPILRNLRITQCYHEFAIAFKRHIGPFANWCTFATWASKQAGRTIRKEDLSHALDAIVDSINPEIADLVFILEQTGAPQKAADIRRQILNALNVTRALDRSADAVARGNLKVFAEIGREFARFLTYLDDPGWGSDLLDRFCASLRHGGPPEGQRYLRRAFTHYTQALEEPDHRSKAELVLLANVEIGLHEQVRLQPEITDALDASLPDRDEVLRRLLFTLMPVRGRFVYAALLLRRSLGRPHPLDDAVANLISDARRRIRLWVTRHMMELSLPGNIRLRLGDDLTARFPESLQHLENPTLLALLKDIDPTPDDLRETGALDWSLLPERLHFIADMFRCYQESPSLFDPPFTPAQLAALHANQIPPAPL